MPHRSLIIYTDGSSRGNPGPAGIGIAVFTKGNPDTLIQISKGIGVTTNNVAEYEAVIHALAWLRTACYHDAVIKLDSELIYRQVTGEYRVRTPHLRTLLIRARKLLETCHDIAFELVGREQNKTANRLAQQASKKKRERNGPDRQRHQP
jgi:ribonuclease HI